MALSKRQRLEHRYAELWEQVELPKLLKNPSFLKERSKEPMRAHAHKNTRREISFGNFDQISESLHPTLGTRTNAKAKHLSPRHKNQHKTNENTITTNQSGTSKDEQTAPCKTLHPKHLKRHKSPITQLTLRIGLAHISHKYDLRQQDRDTIKNIYLNGDDNQ
jgi:hypothetical protein